MHTALILKMEPGCTVAKPPDTAAFSISIPPKAKDQKISIERVRPTEELLAASALLNDLE